MLVVEKSVEKEKSVEISMQGYIISSAEYFATIDFLKDFDFIFNDYSIRHAISKINVETDYMAKEKGHLFFFFFFFFFPPSPADHHVYYRDSVVPSFAIFPGKQISFRREVT